MKRITNQFLDFLFPESCHFCMKKRPDSDIPNLCSSCASQIPFKTKTHRWQKCVEERTLLKLDLPFNDNFDVLVACDYDGPIKRALLNMKFRNERCHALEFGYILSIILSEEAEMFDYIVPLPLHPKRRRQRGFNQSEIIGLELSSISGIPLLTSLLERRVNTGRQSEAETRGARFKNLDQAFICNFEKDLIGKKILLLDDVLTSGASLYSAHQCIQESYSNNINEEHSELGGYGNKEKHMDITGLVLATHRY